MTTEKQELVTKDLVWVKGGFRVSQIQAEAARLMGEQALQNAPSVFGKCWPVLDGFWRHLDCPGCEEFVDVYRIWSSEPDKTCAAAGLAFLAAGRALPSPRSLAITGQAISEALSAWGTRNVLLRHDHENNLKMAMSMLYATYELQGARYLNQFYFLHLFPRFDPRQPHSGEIRLGPLAVPTDLTYAGR